MEVPSTGKDCFGATPKTTRERPAHGGQAVRYPESGKTTAIGDETLVSRRLAVFTGLTRADVNALTIVHFYFDGLVTTVAADVKSHVVTLLAQFPHRLVRDTALDFNVSP